MKEQYTRIGQPEQGVGHKRRQAGVINASETDVELTSIKKI